MTGLLRAELLRLTSRRVVRWLFAAALVVIVVVQGIAFAKSSKTVETRTVDTIPARVVQSVRDFCRESTGGDDTVIEQCVTEQLDQIAGTRIDKRYDARHLLPDVARAVGIGVAILGFVVGASSIGAEWGAGTMQALLFWEPRRIRVVLAKAVALVAVLVAFLAVAEVVGLSTTILNGSLRGTTAGVTGGLWQSSLLGAARCAGLVTFTALFGFAIAGLARVTAAALGVGFVYFVILENLVRAFRPGWVRFLVGDNIAAVVTKGTNVPPAHATRVSFEDFQQFYRLTGQRGALTLAIYLVVLVGAFVVSFQRRDVT